MRGGDRENARLTVVGRGWFFLCVGQGRGLSVTDRVWRSSVVSEGKGENELWKVKLRAVGSGF